MSINYRYIAVPFFVTIILTFFSCSINYQIAAYTSLLSGDWERTTDEAYEKFSFTDTGSVNFSIKTGDTPPISDSGNYYIFLNNNSTDIIKKHVLILDYAEKDEFHYYLYIEENTLALKDPEETENKVFEFHKISGDSASEK